MHTTNKPCVLLDRDGTIIEDRHYLCDPRELKLLPGAAEGLLALQKAGFLLVLVSNQSGVGRGYFSLEDLHRVEAAFVALLHTHDIRLDGLYHCPHAPQEHCECRKPKTGMALAASRDLGFDLKQACMVGDKVDDLLFAQALGIPGILVRTGKGQETEHKHGSQAACIADTLKQAAAWILARKRPNKCPASN